MIKKSILLITAFCLSSWSPHRQTDLTVIVEGLRNSEGKILTGLFDRAGGFPDKAVVGKTSAISGNKITVAFEDLEPGRYALAVIHDENRNGRLDTNGIGAPTEGFCLGNNAMGLFGPPSFKKASVAIGSGVITQNLRMRYF